MKAKLNKSVPRIFPPCGLVFPKGMDYIIILISTFAPSAFFSLCFAPVQKAGEKNRKTAESKISETHAGY
jgi:hypothetical protein